MINKYLAVMQPTFLPWVGYFDLIDQSDVFVFYNDVQFVKQSWQTRNRLNGANGVFYINCPVKKCDLSTNIDKVQIDNTKAWREKIIKTLFYNYRKSHFFEEVHPWMIEFFKKGYDKLEDQSITFITDLAKKLGMNTILIRSSDLDLSTNDRVQKLIDICLLNKANTYISTPGAYDYLSTENGEGRMNKNGVTLSYHQYSPLPYPVTVSNYEGYMSTVDLLYNVGFKNALSHIRAGRKDLKKPSEIKDV
ncbi:WbqC family protein [uncultured Roseivirga sp.]|uniref:WbqC family protein n=1 Tax=uncultured Roseivirga sp. TaxID=543088 RepID=UPI0030DD20FC|tara:strand:+ start:542 stop:1288 length:747 start_codon:yes stop_codon:yes gene_type:complete